MLSGFSVCMVLMIRMSSFHDHIVHHVIVSCSTNGGQKELLMGIFKFFHIFYV